MVELIVVEGFERGDCFWDSGTLHACDVLETIGFYIGCVRFKTNLIRNFKQGFEGSLTVHEQSVEKIMKKKTKIKAGPVQVSYPGVYIQEVASKPKR